MNNQIPTPRTDANIQVSEDDCMKDVVPADFARTLERELSEALQRIRDVTDGALDKSPLNEAIAILISQRDNARAMFESADKRRLQWKEMAGKLATHLKRNENNIAFASESHVGARDDLNGLRQILSNYNNMLKGEREG